MSSTVERFSNRVANYVKYRPDYPPQVLEIFKSEMNLNADSVIADIGAGTGISARIFLENGNQVFAVEPNAAMREAAREFLREFPQLNLIDATAEQTRLPDESLDFVVAAQAFHWFDMEKARAEFKRILRSDGFVALIWNERQLDTTEFLRAYEKFLFKYGKDYAEVRHEKVDEKFLADFFQISFRRAVFANAQTLDFEGLRGRMLSSSYMPPENDPVFPAMNEELQSLFAKYAENGKIQISYDTNVFYARFWKQ